ncbi:spermatogenesis-associated protein 16 [Clupea harengus]|uniref:Spermatogenesis-associated protein 16 n=1 Tax=Clupea harengus TaxID=7950 RepID=A0A8M1KQI3_CLUHA|nr:spermatogenesis-associated protein 16 [Clupea harengus]
MANSAENPGLSGPSKIANRSMSTESEDQRKHSQTPPRENARKKRKRKRKRSDITGPERTGAGGGRAGDGWAEENKAEDNNGNFSSPSSSAPVQRIPLRTLLEAEARLVYGGEQDITHKSSQAPACAGSQLMCQPAEILGPRSGPNLSSLPQIDKWLDVALQDADSCYRQKRYDTAASRFTTALELCSKGAIWEKPVNANYEDISQVVCFIESRLVACYLRMRKPDKALRHSYRSIHLNPVQFRSHLRQAMAYRLLGNPCEAVRSAMIADYLHWLSGDSASSEEHISKLIKQYWQGLLEDAITEEEDFSVMFTPYSGVPSECRIQQAEEVFRKLHPAFTAYLFTDPSGGHFLPQTAAWNEPTPQSYFLTLGFRRSQDGSFLEKLLCRRSPEFTGLRAPFSPPQVEDAMKMCARLGRRILPVLDFIKCTKLAVGIFSVAFAVGEDRQHSPLRFVKLTGERRSTARQGSAKLVCLGEEKGRVALMVPCFRHLHQIATNLTHSTQTICFLMDRVFSIYLSIVFLMYLYAYELYVCVCVCVFVCPCVCVCVLLFMYVHTLVLAEVIMFVHRYSHECECMCMDMYMCLCVCACVVTCALYQVGLSTGAGLIERLQYAGALGQLRRVSEETQVLQHTLAELSVAPYLQDISTADFRLLQMLMADTVDTLEGRRTDGERVWNEMLKVGAMEDLVYELEEAYLRSKATRASRTQRARQRRQARKEQQASSKTSSSAPPPPSLPPPQSSPLHPASPGPQDPPPVEPEPRGPPVPSPGGPDRASQSPQE